jgi:hypothetical protein
MVIIIGENDGGKWYRADEYDSPAPGPRVLHRTENTGSAVCQEITAHSGGIRDITLGPSL